MKDQDNSSSVGSGVKPFPTFYFKLLRQITLLFLTISIIGILVAMSVTCIDVICRIFRISFKGAYDIVMIAGAITITCSLPYTTAVKGHVSIDYFFHKLSKRGRIIVDAIVRILSILLFSLLAIQSIKYGKELFDRGEVTLTLQVPVFWILYVISISCMLVALIIFYNLLHPEKVIVEL